jgi:hypothetical protein
LHFVTNDVMLVMLSYGLKGLQGNRNSLRAFLSVLIGWQFMHLELRETHTL